MLIFRNAKKGDENSILELIEIVLSDYGLNLERSGANFDVNDIMKHYIDNNGWFQVIEFNNKIIGSVGIYKINDSICELRKMYLYKEYQGKGLGKKLLQNALSAANSLGYSTVTLQTNSILKNALPLYKSFGFEEFTEEVCSRCDISMKKNIGITT